MIVFCWYLFHECSCWFQWELSIHSPCLYLAAPNGLKVQVNVGEAAVIQPMVDVCFFKMIRRPRVTDTGLTCHVAGWNNLTFSQWNRFSFIISFWTFSVKEMPFTKIEYRRMHF